MLAGTGPCAVRGSSRHSPSAASALSSYTTSVWDQAMDCELETSIPDWIIEHPQTQRVFDALGLDTGCGGKSLEYVCRHCGLSPQDVLEQLRQIVNQ